jgi:hypothetical protein
VLFDLGESHDLYAALLGLVEMLTKAKWHLLARSNMCTP